MNATTHSASATTQQHSARLLAEVAELRRRLAAAQSARERERGQLASTQAACVQLQGQLQQQRLQTAESLSHERQVRAVRRPLRLSPQPPSTSSLPPRKRGAHGAAHRPRADAVCVALTANAESNGCVGRTQREASTIHLAQARMDAEELDAFHRDLHAFAAQMKLEPPSGRSRLGSPVPSRARYGSPIR